jgi:hypothetical protein
MLGMRALILLFALNAGAAPAFAQRMPAPDDTQHGMLREVALGALRAQPRISDTVAARRCLALPVVGPNDGIDGPHGNSLVSTRCTVVAYDKLSGGASANWTAATYRRASVFTHDGAARASAARDTIIEDEIVVFVEPQPRERQAVWHARFESDKYGGWSSITPELAAPSAGTTLLSVRYCLNGTGGCGQEFLLRRADGNWFPVWQAWLDQLPPAYLERIRHGSHIDPRTLRGDAGFYSDGDANCCPSARLKIELALRGDSLVLRGQSVVRDSTARHGYLP